MADAAPEAAPEAQAAEAAPKSGGGLGAWLPLIVSIVVMPGLAYVMTSFVLVPKLQKSVTAALEEAGVAAHDEASEEHGEDEKGHSAEHGGDDKGHGSKAAKGHEKGHGKKKEKAEKKEGGHGEEEGETISNAKMTSDGKYSVVFGKVLVNLAGSMGTRYLLANLTLVSEHEDIEEMMENNRDQLADLASGALATKTIGDLEKPGARNQIRSEITMLFNSALGKNVIHEVYITEFTIQ